MVETPLITSVDIVERLQLGCSPRTVRNFLHKNNIHCRRPAKKTEFLPPHAEERLNFAINNLQRDWSAVIFTDEKVFSTSQQTRKLVWRPNGTTFEPNNIAPVSRSSRISLAYWGWISGAGPGEIARIDTKMNAE